MKFFLEAEMRREIGYLFPHLYITHLLIHVALRLINSMLNDS